MPEEMPCHLSGLHDTAVSRPYGNNASAFGSMGRREAEREGGVGSRSCCIHSVSQSLRPPSHRDLPSHSPQKHQHLHITRSGIGMVHMVVLMVFTYILLGYSITPCRSQRSLRCRIRGDHHV